MNSVNQQQVNDAEWNNPDRWSVYNVLGLSFGKIYRSPADTRLWVPKSNPRLGWTINLGHPRGALMFQTMVWGSIGLPLLTVAIIALVLI